LNNQKYCVKISDIHNTNWFSEFDMDVIDHSVTFVHWYSGQRMVVNLNSYYNIFRKPICS